ncbi:hypothetical protein WJM97_08635 [Okeanomitos corallinicola TIOX110]|uniref:HD domain-containing protein n=1 Tax=Okeanomitos corallinicola TIOX110 TaxID=3133117 RepID=A0ABZ2UXE0_9CYAN
MSTSNLNNILFYHWQEITQPFNVDLVIANQIFADLILAYSQPHRYYHTLQHIHSVLTTIDMLKMYVEDLSTVKLAVWFHDLVYDTHAKNNEEKSAEYAGEMLKKLALNYNKIEKIQQLILATKNHQADDIDSQVLLDADLGIFAADKIQYQEYVQAIRQEYAWVADVEYIKGRRMILTKFLQRPSIYFTPLMLESSEELARLNIQAELDINN